MEKRDATGISPPPRRVDKLALLLLTFVLGGVGGHKFYLRRYAQGALYAVFFFFAFVTIPISLIEFTIYLFTSEDKLNERYGEVYASPPSKKIVMLAAAILGVFALAVFGVFLPAYHDSFARSRVALALGAAKPWQEAVEGVYARSRRLPSSSAELGVGVVAPQAGDANGYSTVALGNGGTITVTLSAKTSDLEGKTLIIKPLVNSQSGALEWDCTGGTVDPRLRRSSCRTN